MGEISVPSVLR